jgi:hypothetical protein
MPRYWHGRAPAYARRAPFWSVLIAWVRTGA